MSKELDSSDSAQNLKSANFTENYNVVTLPNQTACLFLFNIIVNSGAW